MDDHYYGRKGAGSSFQARELDLSELESAVGGQGNHGQGNYQARGDSSRREGRDRDYRDRDYRAASGGGGGFWRWLLGV